MSNPNDPETPPNNQPAGEAGESFQDLLSQYEQSHTRTPQEGSKGLEGTVVKVTADAVLLDIGFKTEGILPLTALRANETVKPGDKLLVTVKGRGPEGYYDLARGRVARPTDWASLEKAFAEKTTIVGTVIGAVKGGLSIDIGVRAFMPASRSGVRETADMEKMVGQEIRCRITKLDVADEDVVVDRRVIAEEEERANRARRYSEIKEGDTVNGVVRSLADYGAFVDIGEVDGLLHVSDISWSRVNKPADVLTVGQAIEARVLKIDQDKRRISLGMKQLQPHPWDAAAQKYKVGERVRGVVTRLMDFGAFVELEPGVEGLIHVSEMAWSKKVRKPSDAVKPGETVEAVILGVNPGEKRISLGLKQALGDPWADAAQKFPAGSIIEGPVVSLTKFGAFVHLAEGIEGMIHVSEISAEKRINHPQDVLKAGQVVKAQVLEVDKAKRNVRLSIKQMAPSSLDEYIAEHKEGDVVSGRMMEVSGDSARVELGEGVFASCSMAGAGLAGVSSVEDKPKEAKGAKADLSSLSSMLQAKWKSGGAADETKAQSAQTGQIRSFRISKLDPAAKKIELELVKKS
ncbi:MAG TPA: 30S ribosomal protein S1 [Candidatus Angelobacter sp.]|nr:30S ribosomal protein S1 [Candidatus Angelobacter sp.]